MRQAGGVGCYPANRTGLLGSMSPGGLGLEWYWCARSQGVPVGLGAGDVQASRVLGRGRSRRAGGWVVPRAGARSVMGPQPSFLQNGIHFSLIGLLISSFALYLMQNHPSSPRK